jgi:glycosyltransferase involved in cell wall biosynthesis
VAVADVLVNLSLEENLSISLIEAHSVGVPVIALNSGGNSDVVSHEGNGFLVQETSEISERIRSLAEDKKLASELSRQAKLDFESRFEANTVALRYLELYEQD